MNDFYIYYGADLAQMSVRLMQEANIAGRIKAGAKVCIKPNLVVARPAEEGATTHVQIVEGIVQYLQEAGVIDITIAEGSWVGDSSRAAFEQCDGQKIRRESGRHQDR